MFFIIDKNKKFSLNILGYEFYNPDMSEDLNWINVKIDVRDSLKEWKAEGAYLTVIELNELYHWLKEINENKLVEKRLSFIENELSFGFDKSKSFLSIYLNFDFHPKGKNYLYGEDNEYELSFDISKIKMNQVLDSLKKLITEFPIRYKNNYS